MAVEVVRSTVALDHIYARKEEELVDLEKDAVLTETIASLAELTDYELINLFFGTNTELPDDSLSLSPIDDTLSFSPCSDSTSTDSYLTPSPDMMDLDPNADIVSTSSSEGFLGTNDNFTIDVDFDWLSSLEKEPAQVIEPGPTTKQPPASTSIDVLNEPTVTSTCAPTTTYASLTRKAGNILVLTAEEERLLAAEGAVIPTDVALTKAEERILKKVRRKVKNKQSAQDSRKKKKDYVEGLEMRVKVCTEQNMSLHKKVQVLEKRNCSLLDQLKQLQAIVSATHPTKAQAGTCLMVLLIAFGLVLFPINGNTDTQKASVASYATVNVRSRTLLQVSDDYTQDESVNTPKFNPNGSETLIQTQPFELEWEGDSKESLSDLSVSFKSNEKEDVPVHKEKTAPMRTEKR